MSKPTAEDMLGSSARRAQRRLNTALGGMVTSRVEMTPELSAFVATRIASYDFERAENQDWLIPYVRKHQILPLYSAWLETYGILVDGSLRKFSADGEHSEYEGLRELESWQALAHTLLSGAKRYSALAGLVPTRPSSAEACEQCSGRGHFESHPNVVCNCGGLGWLPADAP